MSRTTGSTGMEGRRASGLSRPGAWGGLGNPFAMMCGFYERSYGRFYRTLPLPEGVDPEKAQASFKDGVLEIHLPLPEEQQPKSRQIEVR